MDNRGRRLRDWLEVHADEVDHPVHAALILGLAVALVTFLGAWAFRLTHLATAVFVGSFFALSVLLGAWSNATTSRRVQGGQIERPAQVRRSQGARPNAFLRGWGWVGWFVVIVVFVRLVGV